MTLRSMGLPDTQQLEARMTSINHMLDSENFFARAIYLQLIDFRRILRDVAEHFPKAKLIFNANAINISSNRGSVSHLDVISFDDDGHRSCERRVRAAVFVLCAGTLENTRLLLHSDLANDLPALGHFFNEHPYVWNAGKLSARAKSSVAQMLLKAHPVSSKGSVIPSLTPKASIGPTAIRPNFRAVLGGIGDEPGILNLSWEMLPKRSNYVSLDRSGQKDRSGLYPLTVTCDFEEDDWAHLDVNVRQLMEFLTSYFTIDSHWKNGVQNARMSYRFAPGNHPAGTTRMATNSEGGVTDGSCRVFGTDNLFLTGAGLFHRSGFANPTLTICALARRAAAHISGNWGAR